MSCKKCKTTKCTCETTICINPLIYMMKSVFSLIGTQSVNISILEILANMSKRNLKRLAYSDVIAKAKLNEAVLQDTLNSEFTLGLTESLIDVLTAGITVSNNKDFCCPDCKNGVYFLGGSNIFADLVLELDGNKICCVEHYTSVESWLNVLDSLAKVSAFGSGDVKCCNTDFADAMNNWINSSSSVSDNFYLDELMQLGLIESSSFNGYSGLGILYDFLQLVHPELTKEDYLNILGVIINLGIVIECNGCEMIIASTDTYIDWSNAVKGRV